MPYHSLQQEYRLDKFSKDHLQNKDVKPSPPDLQAAHAETNGGPISDVFDATPP